MWKALVLQDRLRSTVPTGPNAVASASPAPSTPTPPPAPPGGAVHTALKSLARCIKELTAEHLALVKALDNVVSYHNPALRAAYGVGPDIVAQLLVTAGGNPERMRTEAFFHGAKEELVFRQGGPFADWLWPRLEYEYESLLDWAVEIERMAEAMDRPAIEIFFELLDEFRAGHPSSMGP